DTQSNPSSQSPGWFVAGDYSVQAFMATGAGVPEASLVPIAAARTTFLGGMTTTSTGNPGADGSGLWFAGAQDTGLPTGPATIEVRAWYDPNHNTSFDQAVALGVNFGMSFVYNINLVSTTDPTIQSLDSIHMAAFTLPTVPEPSTFALAGLGTAAMLIFRRRK